jgi:methyl-accepting chemotaxis protein
MRLKLFLAFTLIVFVSVSLVAVIARRGAVNEVRTFMFRGGMYGLNELATGLENYFRNNGNWNNVQSIFRAPRGVPSGMSNMMGEHLLLANSSGVVVADTQQAQIGQKLDPVEVLNSIPIIVARKNVGYLFYEGGMNVIPGNEQAVLQRLNRSVLLAGILSVVLGLVVSSALAYTLLRPVRALTEAAKKLAEGDLSQRVEVNGKD